VWIDRTGRIDDGVMQRPAKECGAQGMDTLPLARERKKENKKCETKQKPVEVCCDGGGNKRWRAMAALYTMLSSGGWRTGETDGHVGVGGCKVASRSATADHVEQA
jgi:hypothetical protein